jgi:putative hydroxymethylpyrimidine transport system ATP-binding protein
MSHTPPTIFVNNAHLHYAGHVLFNNLHCTLPAGKTTCLLGPSGVGKSSLLRLIAGLNHTDPLSLQKANITTSDELPLTNRIAYMAQTDLLLPWLTVLENVVLGSRLRQHKDPKNISRARELLAQVGLNAAEKKLPGQLSGGMRQRVALARTLMEDKPVVLMDEPFSALDTVTRLRLQELASHLFTNRTVLLITHDPLEALRMGHHILIMSAQPAQLDQLPELFGAPPRELTDDRLLHLQGEIMKKLLSVSTLTRPVGHPLPPAGEGTELRI